MRQLWPQQRGHPQVASHEPTRKNGRRAACQSTLEKPEQEERLSARSQAV